MESRFPAERAAKKAPRFLVVFAALSLLTTVELSSQPDELARTLSEGDRLRGLLDDPIVVGLELEAGQFVRIDLSFDNSILLNLRGPEGRDLLQLGLGPVEAVPFSFLSEEKGIFVLQVSNGDDRESHQTGYCLEVQEIRQSDIRDPVRVRIERQLLKADHLASNWTRTSMEEALEILRTSLDEARSMGERWLEVRISRSLGILHRRLGAN